MSRISVVFCLAALAGLFAAPAGAQQPLRVSAYLASTHWLVSESLPQWGRELEAASGGALKLNIHATALGRPQQHFELARDGIADVTLGIPGYSPGRFVLNAVGGSPISGNYSESLGTAYWRTLDGSAEMKKEYDGVIVLGVFSTTPMPFFTTNREVRGADDFKGLKTHTAGGMMADVATSLGMVPVIQPPTTAHEVLSSGVVDGIIFTSDGIAAFKLDRLAKHALIVPGGFSSAQGFLVMHPARFNALPADQQAALRKVSGENFARIVGRNWDQRDAKGLEVLKSSGGKVAVASGKLKDDIVARTQGAVDIWLRDVREKRGMDGKPLLDAYRAEIAKVEAEIRGRTK